MKPGPKPWSIEKVIAHFHLRGKRNEASGCLEWTGSLTKAGYGQFQARGLSGIPIYAHCFAWMLKHGKIPDDKFVLHECDNRACFDDTHLFLGSQADNIHDAMKKGRFAIGGDWRIMFPEKFAEKEKANEQD